MIFKVIIALVSATLTFLIVAQLFDVFLIRVFFMLTLSGILTGFSIGELIDEFEKRTWERTKKIIYPEDLK